MKKIIKITSLSLVLLVQGCATFSSEFRAVEKHLVQGRPAQALKVLDKKPGAERDRVLYLLNRGMLQRMIGQYQSSNASLEEAKIMMRKLFATSVSETAGSLLINDGTRSYIGDPYEQVMVHMMKALNYLELNERDSARVEILQMDIRLREIYANQESSYMEDAFGRYLAGIIYEELGDYNDAMVSYRKAYKVYTSQRQSFSVSVPQHLKVALLRMSQHMGLGNENKQYQEQFGITQYDSVREYRQKGNMVVIMGNGLAPIKIEQAIHVNDYRTGRMHRIALPAYRSRRVLLGGLRLQVGNKQSQGDLVDDIDAIAHQTLKEQLPAIKARALARAVAKNAMVKGTKRDRDNHPLLGLALNIATVATERADTRSWVTLPSEMYLASISLPAGEHDVRLQFLGRSGGVVDSKLYSRIPIRAGRNHYLFYHWVSPASQRGR
ncbi:MAG: hypothetical protein HUJ30_03240 [Gammaproteobacteria bacterium]|nr:hypothetical protein [Gammaproteobacteria bacterium]